MGDGVFRQGVGRLRQMRPSRIRSEAGRVVQLALVGVDHEDQEGLARVFVPDGIGAAERTRAWSRIQVCSDPDEGPAGVGGAIVVHSRAAALRWGRLGGEDRHVVDAARPDAGLVALLRAHREQRLALARTFPGLRPALARELIRAAAERNAAFAALSALPDVIPTPLSVLLAFGEMGSDMVVLTANQVDLAFRLAAMSGADVSWRAQSRAIAAVVAGGFGWRALARELVGLVPAGVGLAAKASIAYSGTAAMGAVLWRLPQPGQRRARVEASSTTRTARLARGQQTA